MTEVEEDLPPGDVSKPPPRSGTSGRGRRWVWLGVAPFFLYTFVFLLYPAISILIGAFQDKDGNITTKLVSSLFEHGSLEAYWTSIKLSVITALLGGLFGLLMAYGGVAGRLPKWVRTTLTTFSGVAANFAGVPLAFAFIATLGFTGIITKLLKDAFGLDIYNGGFSLYSFAGLALVYLYFQIPLMILVIVPALDGLRREWREAAENLGATASQYWRLVALPVLMPSLLGAGMLLFGSAFGAYATAYALTSGPVPARAAPDRAGHDRERALGPALRRRARPRHGHRAHVHDDRVRIAATESVEVAAMIRRIPWWSVLWLFLGSAYFLIPLLATAQFSLQEGKGRYGFSAYGTILKDPLFRASLAFSFKLALFTVVLVLGLLVPTAFWVHLKLPRLRPVMEFLTILPFVVPPIVLVVGLLQGSAGPRNGSTAATCSSSGATSCSRSPTCIARSTRVCVRSTCTRSPKRRSAWAPTGGRSCSG